MIDPEKRTVLDIRSAQTVADIPGEPSLRKEQDVSVIVAVFRRLLTETLSSQKVRLSSIGLTGQAHGILGLDQSGKPLTHYVTWEDGRGEEETQPGKTLLQEIRERTGGDKKLATGYGVVTLYHWMNYGVPTGLSRACGIVDYLGLLLTENHAPVTDYTMAETSGMFDLMGQRWDAGLLEALDIPTSLLPRLSPPTEVAGMLKAQWMLDMSNSRDVPVCVTIGDNQAGYLGSVRDPFRSILVNVGTGSQISLAVLPEAAADLRTTTDGYDVTLRPFIDSTFLVAGSALSGGAAYRALKDFFAAVGRDLFGAGDSADLYQKMEDLAEQAGSAAGLCIEPLLGGTRSNPNARGILEGLSFANLKPGPFIYGMQEGIIRILKDMVDPQLLRGRQHLIGSGNGFRRNPLLRTIAADMFDKELLLPEIPEEAAVGAALNGAVAAGIYENFEEARQTIRYER